MDASMGLIQSTERFFHTAQKSESQPTLPDAMRRLTGGVCVITAGTGDNRNASTAPGSAFNATSGIAGVKYAGNSPQNSNNPKSMLQYDAACFQQSQR
jgi:hypothetical protein